MTVVVRIARPGCRERGLWGSAAVLAGSPGARNIAGLYQRPMGLSTRPGGAQNDVGGERRLGAPKNRKDLSL